MNLALTWRARTEPLVPTVAVGIGEAAARLCRALLGRTDEALLKLEGVAGPSIVAVLGEAAELPWVDGVVYVGRDPNASGLLTPTSRHPGVPVALLERALRATFPAVPPPLVLLADPPRLLSLATARPIERTALLRWRAVNA